MELRKLDEEFAVAGQISEADVADIAAQGYKTLISNRPDDELGTVPHKGIQRAAEKLGMQFHYIPVISGSLTDENVKDMSEVLKTAPRPVLAYCRTGARCASLFLRMQG